jgi:hypothetical protein
MTIMQQVAKASASIEGATRAGEFVRYARTLLQARGDLTTAVKMAENNRATAVAEMIKATVSPAAAADHLGDIAQYQIYASSFIASLAPFGAFDFIIADGGFLRVPLHTRIGVDAYAITGDTPAEGAPTPLTSLSLAGPALQERKSTADVVVTDELAKNASPAAFNLFAAALKKAVARATDASFVSAITNVTSIPSITSSGLSAQAFAGDLVTAAQAIASGADSRLYAIVPSSALKALALARAGGIAAFEDLTVAGGNVGGIVFTPSDALTDTIVVIDAQQVAADPGTIQLNSSRHGSLQLSSTPGDGSQQLVSLWQNNMVGLRAERWWGAELLRDDGACVITGVSTTA